MIRRLKKIDIPGLNSLPPVEWEFDYEKFLLNYMNEAYFKAFVLVQDDQVIGTGNVLFEGKTGWLANILVAEKFRRQGNGFQMTNFLVDFLKSKGCKTQILLATELGEPVYLKIGFKKITYYRSFETIEDVAYQLPNAIRALKATDFASVCELDQEVNDENRAHLIKKYYSTGMGYFDNDNELLGFFLPDFGRGLVLAKDKTIGIELLKLKHAKKGRRTFLSVDNKTGMAFFENNEFKEGYGCYRMVLGENNKWDAQGMYSYGSGFCG